MVADDEPDASHTLPLRAISVIAAGTMFMENLDATAIVTAIPAIARDFAVQPTAVSLGISGYMFAAIVCVPLSAWLADRLGTRTVLCTAITLFAFASLLCGVSTSMEMFIVTRVFQGAAAALMSPVARLVVFRNTPKADLMHAVAIITWPGLIAPVLGPPLGGLLTTYASWHWIFFINLPVAAVGIVVVLRYLPQQKSEKRTPFDFIGFALIGIAIGSLMFGLHLFTENSSRWIEGIMFLSVGFVVGIIARGHIHRARHPIVTFDALAIPSFAITSISGGALSRIAINATPFLLPLLFQIVFGYSAFAAGSMVLAYFAGNIGMKIFTTRILRRFGFRHILLTNGAMLAASILACLLLRPASPTIIVMALLLIGGAARSLQMTALNSLTFADVPTTQTSSANILNTVVQQIAMTLGVALAALLLNLSMAARGAPVLGLADFRFAFAMIGLAALTSLLFYRALHRESGVRVSGHQPG